MDFLQELPTLTLVDSTNVTAFAAEVFEGRPPFDEIVAGHSLVSELRRHAEMSVGRCLCQIVSMDLVMDAQGLIALFTFKGKTRMCDAKTGVETLIKTFPALQREAIVRTLHPLDELDKVRFDAMQTVRSLRPWVPKEKEEPEEDSDAILYLPGERNPDPKFASVEAYCLALEEEERIEKASLVEESWQHTLALTDTASISGTLAIQRAKIDWVEMAQKFAAISILSIGSYKLTYIRCHREARRVALLERERDSFCNLAGLVKVAMQHCDTGALPHPSQSRVIKAEFMKRCTAVLKTTHPSAECDIKKLPFKDQCYIYTALGMTSGCEDCPEPAEYYYHWDHALCCWTRQSYPASAPTSSLPETMAICKRCYKKNPWSCTLCRRRDTFTACRGTRLIPLPIDSNGPCTVHRGVECKCGGTFRRHVFKACDEPMTRRTPLFITSPVMASVPDWWEEEKKTLLEEEMSGPPGAFKAIQAHNIECRRLERDEMYALMERERCAMEMEDRGSVKRRRLH